MSSDKNQVTLLLDEMSLELKLADSGDIMALGELLGTLEKVTECYSSISPSEAPLILNALKGILEVVVLDQAPDKAKAMSLAGQGVSLLQELDRSLSGGSPFKGDVAGFIDSVKMAVNIDLGEGQPKEATEKITGGDDGPISKVEAKDATDFSQDRDMLFSFISESMEHIESIEVNIINLETDPKDHETLNAVFRPFHTIKGVAGFLNLHQIHSVTHDVENILDDARSAKISVTHALIDLVLDAVDLLKNMIGDLKEAEETGHSIETDYGLPAFIDRIQAFRQGKCFQAELSSFVFKGQKLGEILIDQGLMSEAELEEILEAKEEAQLRPIGEILVEKGIISAEDLNEALMLQLEDNEHKKLGEILAESGKADIQSISLVLRDQAALREQKLGEFLVKEKRAGARDIGCALRAQKKAIEKPTAAVHTVKIDTVKLDGLVDLVGELVIAQSLVNSNEVVIGARNQKLDRDLAQVGRITTELQKTAMAMRMVPIRQTFQKMIRLVRDLSRKSGKQVELTMRGEDTEIDRNMVEAIHDPLVHMIRNSVDHGIELPAKRSDANKPAQGSIELSSYHQGGNIVIEIRDDGQGLNRDKIMAKAIEHGLVDSGASLSDSEVFDLIFQPGFSTADKITDVSGRGVGMDVVKRAIEKLRGKVEVASKPGYGSTVAIRLPLTLAIIDGIIIRVGQDRYVLPTTAIKESFVLSKNEYHTVESRGEMIMFRGRLFPLIRLHDIFGLNPDTTDPMKALIIVIEDDSKQKCLMVDEVIGKQEVVIKSLGETIDKPKTVAGGTILSDGRVGLILDVAGLLENSLETVGHRISGSVSNEEGWKMDDDWGMGPT